MSLTDAQYQSLAHATLTQIETKVDRWLDDDVVDIDVKRTGGLLELSLPNASKLIVNMQPPLHELWLAAKEGGFHFKYSDEAWRDTRSGEEFFACLSRCATQQLGQPLNFKQA